MAAILLVAVGAVVIAQGHVPQAQFLSGARSLYATDGLDGWQIEWRQIAETEEMRRAQGELLNFDDAAFAIYNRAGLRIAIYAAHWRPGKMSHRLVASHTPDVCWVGGGWKPRLTGRTEIHVREAPARHFQAEHRVFERGGHMGHVLFCHYLGGERISYDTSREPQWYAMFTDFYRIGLRQRDEQLFWRISSDRPVAEIQNEAPVQMFLARVGRNYLNGARTGS